MFPIITYRFGFVQENFRRHLKFREKRRFFFHYHRRRFGSIVPNIIRYVGVEWLRSSNLAIRILPMPEFCCTFILQLLDSIWYCSGYTKRRNNMTLYRMQIDGTDL